MRRTAILALFACLVCSTPAPAQTGSGVWHMHAILRNWDLTALSTGACTLPSELQFARALGTNASETVQTGTSTIVTGGLGANQPRCRRRLDADSVGVLFEAATTNAIVQSRAVNLFPNAGSGDTYTTGQSSPDGTTNAIRVQVISGGFSKWASTAVGSGAYTWSFWEMAGSVSATYQGGNSDGARQYYVGGSASAAWSRVVNVGTGYTTLPNTIPVDGRDQTAHGGIAAGARDVVLDLQQLENRAHSTSIVLTSGTTATRNGERLYLSTAATWIASGRVNLAISLRPEAAPASYSGAVRVFTSGADYCEIATTGVMTCSVGGVTDTTAALTWAQYDSLDLWIAVGGGIATAVSYRVNGGTAVHPTVTGSALGAVSTAGTLELLCNGAASEFGAWVTRIVLMKLEAKPQWAANDNAIRSEVAA